MSQLLQNAVYGTAMILAVVLLRRVLGRRLVPEARLALWAVCLFRLLTPAAPESALSLWGLARLFAPERQQAAPPVYTPGDFMPSSPAPVPQADPGISWETALAVLWLAVGAALAARYVLSWRRTRRAVACAIPLDRSDPRYQPLPRCARLREGPMEGAPLTFGAVRPTVVLSPGLDGPELDCVLAHEGVHARRRDNLWHYAMALALVVHWWNPAVWWMARLLRMDIELSCDRAALKKLGADRRADYAKALVSLATQAEGPSFCQTFGRKAAEERILSIMKFKKTSIIGAVFTLALVLSVTAAFASEPMRSGGGGYSSVKTSGPVLAQSVATREDGAVTEYTVDLTFLEQNLAQHVADGSMTQAEADRILEQAKSFLSEDGKALIWSFQGDSGLTLDSLHGICCRDEKGGLIPLDPAAVVGAFIFPANGYVEEPGDPEDLTLTDRLIGSGNIVYDDENAFASYTLHFAVPGENGEMVAADGSIIGRSCVSYNLCTADDCAITTPHYHVNDEVIYVDYGDPGESKVQYVTLAEYKALLNTLVADGKVTQADADWLYAGAETDLARFGDGTSGIIVTNESGSYLTMPAPSSDPSPMPSAAPDGLTAPSPVTAAPANAPFCAVPGCTETRYHVHSEGHSSSHHTGGHH